MANEGYFSFYLCLIHTSLSVFCASLSALCPSVSPCVCLSVCPSAAAAVLRFFGFLIFNFWQRVFFSCIRMQTASLLWASRTQKARGDLMALQRPRTIVGGISRQWQRWGESKRKRVREEEISKSLMNTLYRYSFLAISWGIVKKKLKQG